MIFPKKMNESICAKEEPMNGHKEDNEDSDIDINKKAIQSERKDQIYDEESDCRKPDADSLKMFVGQIPKEWTEAECRQLLEPFGEIFAINLLKDKRTAKSKGCCFVTYFTRRAALEAQNALHNIRTLPSCHHPIQMKPADTENRNERKLFVGMLSKSMDEQDIKNMFSSYGLIEECSILRDSNGQSKGCAFVTFSSRTSAANAIKCLNHSTTMEGCTSPLVVKFADTQKDKDQRRNKQSLMQQLWTQTTSPLSTSLVTNPYLTLAALTTAAQQQQLATTLALQQQCLTTDLSLASALANPVLMALTGSPQTKVTTPSSPLSLSTHFNSGKLDMLSGVRDQLTFTPSLSTTPTLSVPGVQNLAPTLTSATTSPVTTAKQVEGPEGANLFIYHLPPEFTDNDLITTFSPFGNVISAKVFIDKNSNLSKCFGFVSYDNVVSAQTAIQAMHGFQIRNKRLKVQLKKTRDKPY